MSFRRSIFILLLTATSIYTLSAQEKSDSTVVNTDKFIYNPDHFAYTDLRYGYTKLGHQFHTGLSYKYRFNIFKVAFSHINNFKTDPEKANKFSDASFIYAWSFRKKNFLFSAGFGIGGVWGSATTNQKDLDSVPLEFDPQIKIKTVGFPLEICFAFTPPPKLKTFSSIGLVFFGNFNSQKSYLGAGLNLSIGKVSPKLTEQQKKDPLRDYYVPKQRKQKWYD